MKKLSALIIAALCACAAHAQTSKGTVTLTASFGYSQSTGSADKEEHGVLYASEYRNYTLSPSLGYFIKNNLELGASFYFHNNERRSLSPYAGYINSNKLEYQEKSAKVYARHYKYMTEKLAAYATLSGGVKSWDFDSEITDTYLADRGYTSTHIKDDHYTTFSAAISPGVSFFASKDIAININLGALTYSRHSVDENYAPKDSRYSPGGYAFNYDSNILELDFSSMNLIIGLTYFIRK